MVWLSIAAFELRKRQRMLSSYVYFVLLFACGFLMMLAAGGAFAGVSVGLGSERVYANAPFAVSGIATLISHFGLLITAAVFGQAVHQDYESRCDALFFTTPVRARSYLWGRFAGAATFVLLVFSSIALGLWAGTKMPFVERSLFGPNRLSYYLWPYVTGVIPNLIFTGAIFFALATSLRKMTPVYVGAVVLVMSYLTAGGLLAKLEHRRLAGLIDPFGGAAARLMTEYWTVSEKNTLLVPLRGVLLANRLMWLGVGLALVGVVVYRFRFAHAGTPDRARVPAQGDPAGATAQGDAVPRVKPEPGRRLPFLLARLTWLSFRETVKNGYFGVIVFAGVVFMVITSLQSGSLFGTATWPVTGAMVELTSGSFTLFVLILVTFYSGELVWRERDARMDQIADALPIPTWLPFLSKLLSLMLLQVVLQVVVMLTSIAIQTFRGYHHYELGLYMKSLLGLQLADFCLLWVLAMAVQSIVQHKYMGHFLMVLYYLATLFMDRLGLEHNLYKFGSSPSYTYSDMNGFGHFLRPVLWFDLYWAAFAILLAIVSTLLWSRGPETGLFARLPEARRRFTAPLRIASASALSAFVGLGGFIFYNTNVLNPYKTDHDEEVEQADFEKQYKALAKVPQPRITGVKVAMDIFPAEQRLRAHGTYTLKNATGGAIKTVYVNLPSDRDFQKLTVGSTAQPTKADRRLGFYTFDLKDPLPPGATLALDFDIDFRSRGFKNKNPFSAVVENGTFWSSGLLPSLGYNDNSELSEDNTRKKYGLAPKARMADLNDLEARRNNYITSDADWVTFEATVSTSPDQIAIAPGYLQREWTDGGRRYFHYKMDSRILHFFSVLSARYQVKRDRWKDVALEIYYHPGHAYDLDQMMKGMKDSLDYFTTQFGPYQHRQVRILEFPRYATFAQSFPNTIPYSEAIGFIAKVDPNDPEDVDYPYYITAHEVAHQWWAHQVIGGNVQGATFLSETMAQYSALMVMKRAFGADKMKRFLKYELHRYLRGRGMEKKRELPLLRVENQQYIHYGKGSLVMYALQDYLGEEKLNRALADYLRAVKFQEPPYTHSLELYEHLRKATPPELQYLLTDLFEHITLYDNRATSATWRALDKGRYEVTLQVHARKLRADDLGAEREVAVDDLIDVGVLDDKGVATFLEKRRIKAGENTLTLVVDHLPVKAGIDPLNKLVDRKPDDNAIRAVRK